jgi:sulfite exporter TauE/SafE/copper chaperone CopZ
MTTHIFHVKGMHCKSCVVLTESELMDVPGVSSARASLEKLSVEVTGDFGDTTAEQLARELSAPLAQHGYELLTERPQHEPQWKEFYTALPIALLFVLGFLLLQKTGLVNLVNTGKVSYGTAFLIGLIASVSSCMAVVGGLVLSMSTTFAKESDSMRPQLFFHVGRLISFFVLGGVIGALGSVFQLGGTSIFILGVVVAFILLVLGINLLDIFPWAKKLQPTLPAWMGKRVHGLKTLNHTLTPALVGIATFFLPCGFTQSMQLYALTTGTFMTGALIMISFALGTLPVLALLSFSSTNIRSHAYAGVFFKTAGLVVIFFGVFNLISSLVGAGVIPPLFSL